MSELPPNRLQPTCISWQLIKGKKKLNAQSQSGLMTSRGMEVWKTAATLRTHGSTFQRKA